MGFELESRNTNPTFATIRPLSIDQAGKVNAMNKVMFFFKNKIFYPNHNITSTDFGLFNIEYQSTIFYYIKNAFHFIMDTL